MVQHSVDDVWPVKFRLTMLNLSQADIPALFINVVFHCVVLDKYFVCFYSNSA